MRQADRRVLFFGDSLFAGVGDPAGEGWVGRLADEAATNGLPFAPLNFGVPGETSGEIVARWRGQAEGAVPPDVDGRVVFSFGANDTTELFGRLRVGPESSVRNLEVALSGAADLGLPALVVGPAPVNDDAQHRRIIELGDAFAAICDRFQVPFVPVARDLIEDGTWVSEARAGDGAHPATGGYEVLAHLIGPTFLEFLRLRP